MSTAVNVMTSCSDGHNGSMSASARSRRVGLLLIVVVLLAVAVVPGVGYRMVAGTPVASPVPGPPVVGDCVLEPVDPYWDDPAVAGLAGSAATYAYPRLATAPCRGSRYGEVTSVTLTPAAPMISVSSDGTFVNDPNVETCAPSASRYIGLAITGTQRAPLLGGWYPSQIVEAAAITASIQQAAAGQHWLACIIYLGRSPVDPLAVADQERYDGSLLDAMSTGRQRNRIGTCALGSDLTGGVLGLIGCTTAHRSEVFAAGGSGTRTLNRADLQRSCDQVVERLTGIGDLHAAGFTIEVQAIASNGTPIKAASIPPEVNLSCGVTSSNGRNLNGSLLALGRLPIPWV